MDSLKSLVHTNRFELSFEINHFTNPLRSDLVSFPLHTSEWAEKISIIVRCEGILQEDKDYVTFEIVYFDSRREGATLNCSFILNVLDVKGEKKSPCSYQYVFHTGNNNPPQIFLEKYIKRDFILNNASDYLKENTLTAVIEGTVEVWEKQEVHPSSYTFQQNLESSFKVKHLPGLKVYLRKYSVLAKLLMRNSSVFRDVWGGIMRESQEENVLLENEEIPAFLNMLIFLGTKLLILQKITLFELYKVADKYDVPTLLQECREYIERFLADSVDFHSNFIKLYDNKESSETNTLTQSLKRLAEKSDFEALKYATDLLSPEPVRPIETIRQMDKYLKQLRKEMKKYCRSGSRNELWTPEENCYNFKTKWEGNQWEVYLREDSEHAKILMKYSSDSRTLQSLSTSMSEENFFHIQKVELRPFLCMLWFLESGKMILHEVTVYDMYKISNKYDIPILNEKCKKYIGQIILKTISDILDFAKFYDDKRLEKFADSYLKKHLGDSQEDVPNLDELGGYQVCDTRRVSSTLIKSKWDFLAYLSGLESIVQTKVDKLSETKLDSESFNFYN